MQANLTVGEHLLNRLAEAGVDHLFGVPGDYNLVFLDQVIAHPAVRWVGNANELNAAYAADGYARLNGFAAMLTTFGVGELSAINGIAGCYAERVPVLHVVGAPSLGAQQQRLSLHHSLCDGDFSHFMSAAREVTIAQAALTAENAVEEIDRVLSSVLRERRPGYLLLPTDVARSPITTSPRRFQLGAPRSSAASLAAFCQDVERLLGCNTKAAVLADFLVDRFGARSEVHALIEAGSLANATLSMGKGVLDENGVGYVGVYSGQASAPQTREAIESADVVIAVGVLFADVLTAGFTHRIDARTLIEIQPFEAKVAGRSFPDIPMDQALTAVTKHIRSRMMRCSDVPKPAPIVLPEERDTDALSQVGFWSEIQRHLKPHDLIVADQGTSFYGSVTLRLPEGANYIGNPLWASIGYGIPAAFGAQTRRPDARAIVFVGDGSAQLTVQEIGSMLRDGMKPIIFLLNNDGYAVERAIHGPEQRYNDIAQWDWARIPGAMGRGCGAYSTSVRTIQELRHALTEADKADALALIEVMLPKFDIPPLLKATCDAVAARNAE